MKFRELIIEKIGYTLAPCLYNRFHDPLFEFIESKIPREFINKKRTILAVVMAKTQFDFKRSSNP